MYFLESQSLILLLKRTGMYLKLQDPFCSCTANHHYNHDFSHHDLFFIYVILCSMLFYGGINQWLIIFKSLEHCFGNLKV